MQKNNILLEWPHVISTLSLKDILKNNTDKSNGQRLSSNVCVH